MSGTTALTWDGEDKLTSYQKAGSAGPTTYLYDASGNQLIRRDPGRITITLGNEELVYDTTVGSANAVTGVRYYPIPGGITLVRQGGKSTYQIADHHGTGVLALDGATLAETRRLSDPFGKPRGNQPTTWAGSRGFVGGTKDDATGLTNLGAREYQPGTGRFLNPDPVIDPNSPQQWDAYAYSGNDPVNSSDPSGLCRADQCGIGTPIGGTGTGPDNPLRVVTEGPIDPSDPGSGYIHHGVVTKPPTPAPKGSVSADVLSKVPKKRLDNFKEAVHMIMEESPKTWNVPGTPAYQAIEERARHMVLGDLTLEELWDAAKGQLAGMIVGLVGAALCPETWGAGCLAMVGAASGMAAQCVEDCKDTQKMILSAVAGAAMGYAGGKLGEGFGGAGCSFSPDTQVLLGDGSTKDIASVGPGDEVRTGDGETGAPAGSDTVRALWINHDKDLLDVTVSDAHGNQAVLRTTANHPFWDDTAGAWVPAGKLEPGHHLSTPDGSTAVVASLDPEPGVADRFNLTVDDHHTYYVLAGNTPVLVHNSNCNLFNGGGWQHVLDEHVDGSPGVAQGNTTFSNYADLDEIGELIEDTAKTPGRPNTPDAAGRPRDGTIHTHDFGCPVGSQGETSVEVVLNPDGSLRTAYPR
ncbi:polymorphic toxin-type HINT domain-containing protein [Kitasatospora sp. NPDC092286]|uniref:polymorphic toxin-type HINT domain-containing protein n=1 Tax=Kitasatospora sp. NPDC092286 TaxID=3364087 RepID=UPI003824BD37